MQKSPSNSSKNLNGIFFYSNLGEIRFQILISQRDKHPKGCKCRCGLRLFIRRAGACLPPKTKQISVFIKVCRERLSLKYKLFITSQPRRALKLKGFRRETSPRPTEFVMLPHRQIAIYQRRYMKKGPSFLTQSLLLLI